MVKKSRNIIATEKEVETFNSTLTDFTTTLKNRLNELREQDKSEIFFCEDLATGKKLELHSRVLDVIKLTTLGMKTFNKLSKQTQTKTLPVGIG